MRLNGPDPVRQRQENADHARLPPNHLKANIQVLRLVKPVNGSVLLIRFSSSHWVDNFNIVFSNAGFAPHLFSSSSARSVQYLPRRPSHTQ